MDTALAASIWHGDTDVRRADRGARLRTVHARVVAVSGITERREAVLLL
jgi:hypothetical protein